MLFRSIFGAIAGGTLPSDQFHVFMDRQAAGVFGRTRSGQAMVWTRGLIAIGNRGFFTEEQRAIAAQPIQPPIQIIGLNSQMLRRIFVGGGRHFFAIFAQNNLRVISPGRFGIDPIKLGQIRDQAGNSIQNFLRQRLIIRHQPNR